MSTKNGMFLHKGVPVDIKEALWWEETCIRRQGGYDLDTTNLPSDFRWLPKGTPLAINETNGKAIVVKTAVVYANAAKDATTIQIVENPLIKVGDKLAGSTISAITTADGVSTLTVSALSKAVTKDTVVDSLETTTKLLGLAYETTDLRDVDFPQVTPTLQAFEIEEDSMPFPINDAIKEKLGPLHQFKIQ